MNMNMILVFKLGNLSPWLLLLFLIPGLGFIIIWFLQIIAIANICQKLGYNKLLSILSIIPLAHFVLFSILAWAPDQRIIQSNID